jgi:hypothetical protein
MDLFWVRLGMRSNFRFKSPLADWLTACQLINHFLLGCTDVEPWKRSYSVGYSNSRQTDVMGETNFHDNTSRTCACASSISSAAASFYINRDELKRLDATIDKLAAIRFVRTFQISLRVIWRHQTNKRGISCCCFI